MHAAIKTNNPRLRPEIVVPRRHPLELFSTDVPYEFRFCTRAVIPPAVVLRLIDTDANVVDFEVLASVPIGTAFEGVVRAKSEGPIRGGTWRFIQRESAAPTVD